MNVNLNQIGQWILQGAALGIGWKLLNFALAFVPTNLPAAG